MINDLDRKKLEEELRQANLQKDHKKDMLRQIGRTPSTSMRTTVSETPAVPKKQESPSVPDPAQMEGSDTVPKSAPKEPQEQAPLTSEKPAKKSPVKSPSKKAPVKVTKSAVKADTVQIKSFPSVLLARAKAEFPQARTNADAISAYILMNTGEIPDGIPDSVLDLLANRTDTDPMITMDKRMHIVQNNMYELMRLVRELEVGVSYLTFDRAGFRKMNPRTARDIDFMEPGVTDVVARLREQSHNFAEKEAIRKGQGQKL